jgi:antitoxin PrlF
MDGNNKEDCCSISSQMSCCKVEALVSIDERGQMVLPKELREKVGIKPGDKLAVTSFEKDGKVCCLSLIKADELTGMITSMLGPVMDEIIRGVNK